MLELSLRLLRSPRLRPQTLPFVFLVLAAAGCAPAPNTTKPGVQAISVRAPAETVSVRQTPEYRRAEALFREKDFTAALALLDGLAADPSLSSSDRAFLNRQRDICRDAIDGKQSPRTKSVPVQAAVKPASAPLGDCGPRALAIVARHLGVKADVEVLTKAAGTTRYGTSMEGMEKAARGCGLEAEGVQMNGSALKQLVPPAIAWVDGEHYLAVLKLKGDQATVRDPNRPNEEVIKTDELLRRSGGILLTIRKL